MHFRVRGLLAAVFVISLLIQMQIAANGYADRRAGIAFNSTKDGNSEIYVMDSDGIHRRQLSERHDGWDTSPDWYAPVGGSVSPASNFVTTCSRLKYQ